MPWYVLHTKPRCEKKLADTLKQRNIRVFCPLQETVRQWSDRKKKVTEPLFKSYLFVFLNDYEKECADVLMHQGAVRFLWWSAKPGVVHDREIQAIEDFLQSYKNSEITIEIKKGQSVVIKEGPLKNRSGIVYQTKGDKVYLHLKSLGMNLIAKVQMQLLQLNDI